jgi:hypothetical protein
MSKILQDLLIDILMDIVKRDRFVRFMEKLRKYIWRLHSTLVDEYAWIIW